MSVIRPMTAPVCPALAGLMIALASSAVGQPTSTPRPGWLPANVRWSAGIKPTDRAAAMATLRRIENLLLEVPELATPDGFEIQPGFAGGGLRTDGPDGTPLPNAVITYFLGLSIYAPTKKIAGEGCTCVSIVVNDVPPPAKHRTETGLPIYLQSELYGVAIPGAAEVHGELWNVPRERSIMNAIFHSADELPWRLVTREEFARALIFEYEGKDGARLAELQGKFAKTPYQEWVEGAAERRKTREEALRSAAMFQSAAEVAKLKETLEATEREVTERLLARDSLDRRQFAEARSGFGQYSAELRATFERMSPAERQMPALVDNALDEGPLLLGYRLGSTPARSSWPVRTPNYDFWRVKRSPVEVRSIRVHIGITGTGLRPKVHRALWAAFQKLDWAAFNRMLDTPR